MRILLVEDDPDLAELVVLGLRNEAYAVDLAGTYAAAEELLGTTSYDVACFDLGLPDGDGLGLVRRVSPGPVSAAAAAGHHPDRTGRRRRPGRRARRRRRRLSGQAVPLR